MNCLSVYTILAFTCFFTTVLPTLHVRTSAQNTTVFEEPVTGNIVYADINTDEDEGFDGDVEDRIAGGDKASLMDYPYNVQFFNRAGMCGGAILTSKIVLTAAHCFDVDDDIDMMKIVSNVQFIFDIKSKQHHVRDFIIHENYGKPETFSNDIAVIMIYGSFNFSKTVQKALLVDNAKWMTEKETQFVVTGWGGKEKDQAPQPLMVARLRYISHKNCIQMSKLKLSKDMFCLFGDGLRDTCKGDSGGAVLWRGYIVGVISHGVGCVKTPSVYTNVYYSRAWIKRSVEKLYARHCRFTRRNVKEKKIFKL